MKIKTIKARIALKFLWMSLLAFLISLVILGLLLPMGTFKSLVVSTAFFSVFVFVAAYITGAYELWPFKKIAEGGDNDDLDVVDFKSSFSEEAPEEVRHVQDVLRAFKARMDEAVLSQKSFLADASHEIRSPLTIMKGNIEIALRKDRAIDEYKSVLEDNLEEIDRLEFLVKDLMFLARTDASELLVSMVPMRLEDILEEVNEKLLPLARSKGITLELERPYGQGKVMEGDKDRLRQLFYNLVENALRYTPSGGSVKIEMRMVAGVFKVTIKDTGIGIPEGDLDKIFDRFYRVEKARSRVAGGTGLGLCICKWIVDAHEGEISIKSKEGEGTEVTVLLLEKQPGSETGEGAEGTGEAGRD